MIIQLLLLLSLFIDRNSQNLWYYFKHLNSIKFCPRIPECSQSGRISEDPGLSGINIEKLCYMKNYAV